MSFIESVHITPIVVEKPLKKIIKLVVWYPDDGSIKWQLHFSTDADMPGKNVIDIYRTRFQIEFFFRSGKQHTD